MSKIMLHTSRHNSSLTILNHSAPLQVQPLHTLLVRHRWLVTRRQEHLHVSLKTPNIFYTLTWAPVTTTALSAEPKCFPSQRKATVYSPFAAASAPGILPTSIQRSSEVSEMTFAATSASPSFTRGITCAEHG